MNSTANNLISCLVLSGGQSTRMGSDKGLLKQEDLTWAQLAFTKLSSLRLPVFVSINNRQYTAYSQLFHQAQLVEDKEELQVKGPLLGLLSTHLDLPTQDLLVLACDMKDITIGLLQQLLNEYAKGASEAYVYTTSKKQQPLCAIYTSNGLQKIYFLLQNGGLRRHSMMHALECIDTKYLMVSHEEEPFFNNYNQPSDLS